METKDFIEKAREGGWHFRINFELQDLVKNYSHEILLDPLAWKACGKVAGWKDYSNDSDRIPLGTKRWKHNMHRMIDALAEGKSIESFIKTL